MEKYEFFRPMSNGDFSRRVEEVYVCLTEYLATELSEGRHLQYAKVFLSDIQNQEPVFKSSDLYKKVLSAKPLTIIEQPPADGSKITVLVKTSSSLADFVSGIIKSSGLPSAVFVPIIKCVGIAVLTKLVCNLCKDAGQNGTSSAVEYLGSAAMVYTAMPLLGTLLKTLEGLT